MTLAVASSVLALLLVALAAWRTRRELVRWLGRDPFAARRGLRALLLVAAVAGLAATWLYAAQRPPRFSGAGLDVVLAIDVSSSMDTADTAPSRMRRALRFAERLTLAAQGTRLGLVMFAGDAYVGLPLTLDRSALLEYLRSLDSDLITKKGTDLTRALRVSAGVFDPRSPRPRVLVLLTDGEHAGSGLEDPLVELRGAGIRVIAVGLGTAGGGVVPGARGGATFDPTSGRAIVSRRADPVLARIGEATGGAYYREREDTPDPAAVLPSPEAFDDREDAPGGETLELLLVGLLALLLAELWISTAPRSEARARQRVRDPAAAPAASPHTGARAPAAVAAALAALALTGCPPSTLEEGDERYAEGEHQKALSLYRRVERTQGPSATSQIRIGNSLYRLERSDRAAAAYLEALRHVGSDDTKDRFVASFNMGDTLLQRERFAEARDHFWTALIERPESLEAKFNYEWALERVEPPPELPPTPSDQPDQGGAPSPGGEGGEGKDDAQADGDGEGSRGSRQNTRLERQRSAPRLQEAEARRWLETIEDAMDSPLRRQIGEELGAERRPRLGGQTW